MILPPVIMVHGAFCAGWVFERFQRPFIEAGCEVVTPDLPGHAPGASPEAVRGLSMSDYAASIAATARALGRPAVIVGHSLGGLVALLAAARTRTAGVVLLAPSPPWGVSGSTMEEAVSALGLYALGPYWAQAVRPDYPTLKRCGADRLASAERQAVFARMGPESGRALFETLNWWLDPLMTTLVPAGGIGAPILALAGERDIVHPPATVLETARRIGARAEVLPDMSHWLVAEPGWRVAADLSLAWIAEGASRTAA
ncbi:MAG TPA: alpha/beta hydrolase [Caulobacteraceae bacterium]|nr:alpha/beta hydrolase [Caulobacteraceae bacterium]